MSITRQLTVKLCDAFHITLLIAAKIPFRLNLTTNTLTEVVLSLGRFWLDQLEKSGNAVKNVGLAVSNINNTQFYRQYDRKFTTCSTTQRDAVILPIMFLILKIKKKIHFSLIDKRQKNTEFETWEKEEYCPGVPRLPLGRFTYCKVCTSSF